MLALSLRNERGSLLKRIETTHARVMSENTPASLSLPSSYHYKFFTRQRSNSKPRAVGRRELVALPGLALIPIRTLDRVLPRPPDFHAVGNARYRGNVPPTGSKVGRLEFIPLPGLALIPVSSLD